MKGRLKKLTLKERIIKRLSIDKVIPENVITQVISHQFNSANKALHDNNTVELSGFGKFIFNQRKANVRLKELIKLKKFYEKEVGNGIEEKKKENFIKNKISTLSSSIESLSLKLEKIEK